MNYQDRYNSERYLDMTAYLALRNIEREERRLRMREDRIYRRGDVYKRQDNDTSVIRGPATMKAGRLDSYGAVQHTAA